MLAGGFSINTIDLTWGKPWGGSHDIDIDIGLLSRPLKFFPRMLAAGVGID